ncbi:MAG: hypothetical protein MJB14_03320 [Spirochaetes bacterium]|nr:hypothetical protein [Spirochaetota bacterium]
MKYIFKLLLSFIFFILFACSQANSGITIADPSKRQKKNEDQEIKVIKKEKPADLATLFYPTSAFVPQKPVQNNRPVTVQPKPTKSNINSQDYKVIAEWMVNDVRQIKIKNLRTREEIIIKEGDPTGKIILVERSLFYYKLKIDGEVIQVNR